MPTNKYILAIIAALAFVPFSFGQAAYSNQVTTVAKNVPPGAQAPIYTVPNAKVYICIAVSGQACSSFAALYSDAAMTQPISQPIQADGQGRYTLYVAAGTYTQLIFSSAGTFLGSFPFTVGGSGGGTVVVNYGQPFTNATTVTLLDSGHNLNTANIVPYCKNSSGYGVTPSSIYTNPGTFDVTVYFSVPQSGTCVLNGSGGSGSGPSGSYLPLAGGTLTGPLTTNILNTVVNPTTYAGADIGAKINAAIAANSPSRIVIPAGTYSFSTAFRVPRGYSVSGMNSATILNWTGLGPAIIASDVPAPGKTVQAFIGGFLLNGTSTTGQVGVYQGGDPTCTGGCTANPSTNTGYGYVLHDIVEYNMDNGVFWGNATFNVDWMNVHFNGNLRLGFSYPSTSVAGGQNNHFYHSEFSGNAGGAFNINQPPAVTFGMFGMDIEYNGNTSAPGTAFMVGGNYICEDCHIEGYYGPFVEVTSNSGSAALRGGSMILTATTGTDPQMVLMDGGKGNFSMTGTTVSVVHTVTHMVTTSGSSSLLQLSVQNISLIDSSFFLKDITNMTSRGISWCLPYDNSTGTTPGACFDGKSYSNAIGTTSGANTALFATSGGAYMVWNGDGASGGADFYDSFSAASSTAYAFRWTANLSGTYTTLGTLERDGYVSFAGYKVNGVQGITGTANTSTAGCVLTINGGIITAKSGC